MVAMFDDDDALTIDCDTCVATGTTACNDCVVGHVLANEDGPIGLVLTPQHAVTVSVRTEPEASATDPADSPDVTDSTDATDRAVELFVAAGLLDDPPVFVAPFPEGDPPGARATHPAFGPGRRHPSRGRSSLRSR